jgi:hypothetical protein
MRLKTLRYLFLQIALGTLTCSAATVYFNDFESAVGPGWSSSGNPVGIFNPNTVFSIVPSRNTLGQFSADTVTLTLAMPQHTQVHLAFDFYALSSWYGNGEHCCGPDVFRVQVAGGPTLLNATFSNQSGVGDTQSFPSADISAKNPAGSGSVEGFGNGYALYKLAFDFPDTSPALTISFAGIGLQGIADESWAIDNVLVSASAPEPGTFAIVAVFGIALAGLHARRNGALTKSRLSSPPSPRPRCTC